ncbi:hypothetical protein BZ13_1589 [Francisella philomiragia subsp. philomiragia ATCC 25015]|uniref:hypothetical protein n=1 Tax=Francisella philomiragia TaxID=28110 RepID=UPI0001AF793C|nr:hypothetical protein [Francisella philomiragia]AJI74935.1 hypothetical protein BZ13_1589 [Francisella philomiragia subsp. philomiragia ATCC 25015]EET20227.1 predicted protein [Francisella philomiragia subsp. philomiragia ATCC 25015]MBK2237271.1 hypothetical protein [Francisella philomiragia]
MTTKKDKKGTIYINGTSIEIRADRKQLDKLCKNALAKNKCSHDVLKTYLINAIDQSSKIHIDLS